jgi:glutamine amidotransferase PdxT
MVVIFGLTLRQEHRLRLFEIKVLRIVFGRKREEVAGDCKVSSFVIMFASTYIIGVIISRRMLHALQK